MEERTRLPDLEVHVPDVRELKTPHLGALEDAAGRGASAEQAAQTQAAGGAEAREFIVGSLSRWREELARRQGALRKSVQVRVGAVTGS